MLVLAHATGCYDEQVKTTGAKMSLIRIDHQTSPQQLWVFAAIWTAVFGSLGLTAYAKSSVTAAAILGAVAALAPLAGAVSLPALRWLYLGAAYLAFPIGFVVSHLVLATIYYLIFTPAAVCLRLARYDPLRRQLKPDAETFWIVRTEEPSAKSYFKQF